MFTQLLNTGVTTVPYTPAIFEITEPLRGVRGGYGQSTVPIPPLHPNRGRTQLVSPQRRRQRSSSATTSSATAFYPYKYVTPPPMRPYASPSPQRSPSAARRRQSTTSHHHHTHPSKQRHTTSPQRDYRHHHSGKHVVIYSDIDNTLAAYGTTKLFPGAATFLYELAHHRPASVIIVTARGATDRSRAPKIASKLVVDGVDLYRQTLHGKPGEVIKTDLKHRDSAVVKKLGEKKVDNITNHVQNELGDYSEEYHHHLLHHHHRGAHTHGGPGNYTKIFVGDCGEGDVIAARTLLQRGVLDYAFLRIPRKKDGKLYEYKAPNIPAEGDPARSGLRFEHNGKIIFFESFEQLATGLTQHTEKECSLTPQAAQRVVNAAKREPYPSAAKWVAFIDPLL